MKTDCNFLRIASILILILLFTSLQKTFAHCDGLDGPVVMAAKKALETENVNLVLIWVKKDFEEEVKKSFQKAIAVRKLSVEAKEMADMYFYETLVRLHRQGEGAPYTGLKPAGRDLGPAIPLADKSIEVNSANELAEFLSSGVQEGLHQRFQNIIDKKKYNTNDIEAGRKYIEAYVVFMHYVEGIYEAIKKSAEGHYTEDKETEKHKH